MPCLQRYHDVRVSKSGGLNLKSEMDDLASPAARRPSIEWTAGL